MAERPVINASPLIFLSKAGLLSLLTLVGEEFVVPEAVATEIQRKGPEDPTVQALAKTAWLTIQPRLRTHKSPISFLAEEI